MGVRTVLWRIAANILGMVDAYWAMREPGQYGDRPPQCELQAYAADRSPNCRQ
ncbi:MAG: hypothetical protein ACON4T_01345 [Synechococcus sp.]